MNNILEDLKKHFSETPREKVLEDIEAIRKRARRGPTVSSFIHCSREHLGWKLGNYFVINEINDILANPKYTSGSLFLKTL